MTRVNFHAEVGINRETRPTRIKAGGCSGNRLFTLRAGVMCSAKAIFSLRHRGFNVFLATLINSIHFAQRFLITHCMGHRLSTASATAKVLPLEATKGAGTWEYRNGPKVDLSLD